MLVIERIHDGTDYLIRWISVAEFLSYSTYKDVSGKKDSGNYLRLRKAVGRIMV